MSMNPTEPRSLHYRQDFAFSTNYLDYEIPDFRGIIRRSVPVSVRYEDGAVIFQIGDKKITQPTDLKKSIEMVLIWGAKIRNMFWPPKSPLVFFGV